MKKEKKTCGVFETVKRENVVWNKIMLSVKKKKCLKNVKNVNKMLIQKHVKL